MIDVLVTGVPRTVVLRGDNADELWAARKRLFFKPDQGFGSRGTYKGAKLTRKTWASIIGAGYVAQELVPPSERLVVLDGEQRSLKLDVRCYTYQGDIQVGGLIAGVGQRMISGISKMILNQFFKKMKKELKSQK